MKPDGKMVDVGSYRLTTALMKDFTKSPLIPGQFLSEITKNEQLSLFFSIAHHSANAIVITNAKKDIIYVNKRFEDLSGYTLSEVLGKNPRILNSGKTPDGTYRDMYATLEMDKSWKGVFFNVHRNGNEYVEEAVISPLLCDSGEVVYYVAEKRDITSERAAEERVWKLAHFDTLTELPNRAWFINELTKLINVEPSEENLFSVLFADLDRFKELNDSSGHVAGDMALREVAKRIKKLLPLDDFIARVGGDEFVVIHRQATKESTRKLCLQLVEALNEPIPINEGQEAILGISVGSAMWPKDGSTLNQILSRADLAMYEAKLTSCGYIVYGDQIGTKFHRELKVLRNLKKAIRGENQFHLKYQPKYHLATNKLAGLEVLLRWKDPVLGSISPAEFIPIAEKNKMMRKIGEWVFEAVCKEVSRWKSKGWVPPGRVAVNISVSQLEHPSFFEDIMRMVIDKGLSPNLFELEVTESVLISNPEKTMHVLRKLEQAGFSISIDDFGTGFSSLSYLKNIKASILKIDKSFIDGVLSNMYDKMIVNSVINLAHNLGLSVVAEGVENEEQVQFLKEAGCDMVQGYYYSKPVAADDFIRTLLLNDGLH